MYRSFLPTLLLFSLVVHSPQASAAWWDRYLLSISGTPAASVKVGSAYSFQPSVYNFRKSALAYSISNKPSWASFSISTGKLSGTPTTAHVGKYSNITIKVSDGRITAQLAPFAIEVIAVAAPAPAPTPVVNKPPTIGGTSPAQVTAASTYSFKPTASDPDGDNLVFSVSNKPAWAAFDAATGTLSGTPTATQVGVYGSIAISVSDGRGGSASLPAFSVAVVQSSSGRVTVSWTPPSQNTNGTAVTNLSGYAIRYGVTSGGPYPSVVTVSDPSLNSYLIENLTPGTYYFVVTARNSSGAESAYSSQVSKAVN